MRPAVATLVAIAVLVSLAGCAPRTAPPPAPPEPTGEKLADLPDAPPRDLFDLAQRYRGVETVPLPDDILYAKAAVGSQRSFYVIDPIPPSAAPVETTLRHVGRHALWYVANDVRIQDDELAKAAREFDAIIFPHVMETFAPDLEMPGPIAIVTTNLNAVAGYFNASDALPRSVYRYSNERVSVFVSPRNSTDHYLGTLAHELQHVVHWLAAPLEETWINEGLSEFAARSLSFPGLSFSPYLREPNVSPVDWPEQVGETLRHYAGASLFIEYLAYRTGTENVHILVSPEANGIEGITRYLDSVALELSFEELYLDWLVANLVDADSGPYAYSEPPGSVNVEHAVHGPTSGTGEVQQLGGGYMRIEPGDAPLTFRFDGNTATAVLPVGPYSGEHCWWSNRGDHINSKLTRELDLSDVDEATLRFWTWYHIEEDWDHGYVSVSPAGSDTWTALSGEHTRTDGPLNVTYGPAYTGRSNGWVAEEMDLSDYAGEVVELRFEYVTDEAVNTIGWCVDNIEVPEVGFFDDVESEEHGWNADGFVRLGSGGVEQRFFLRLVAHEEDGVRVTDIPLDERNNAEFMVEEPATLIVTGMAPKTSLPGTFAYEVVR